MTLAKVIRNSPDDEDEVQMERKLVVKWALIWFFKKFLLLLLLAALTLIGTYAFQALEKPNELDKCKANEKLYIPMEQAVAAKLWSIGQSYYHSTASKDEGSTIATIREVIAIFTKDVMSFRSDGYTGQNCSLMGTDEGVQFKWNVFGAMLFAVTIFTTVGYGNIAPVTSWGRIVVFAYSMIGIPTMLWCLATVGAIMADIFRYVYVNICCLGFCARRARLRRRQLEAERRRSAASSSEELQNGRKDSTGNGGAIVVDDLDEDDDDDDEEAAGHLRVPLTITLLVVFGYIGMGAAMFGVWENWTPMEAAYFCFITVTTIGFGDYVPGAAAKGIKSSSDAFKLIVDAVYIVFGMAIVSMSFSLIQENITNKARSIEQKIEDLHGDDDDDDGSENRSDDGEMDRDACTKQPHQGPGPAGAAVNDKKPAVDQAKSKQSDDDNDDDDDEDETSFSKNDDKKDH